MSTLALADCSGLALSTIDKMLAMKTVPRLSTQLKVEKALGLEGRIDQINDELLKYAIDRHPDLRYDARIEVRNLARCRITEKRKRRDEA
ncbi:MAG: hypothetical protein KJ993_14585 [Actinobacteria bacterium]|nr:hypothetical protein [Actinomycetota bacterium]